MTSWCIALISKFGKRGFFHKLICLLERWTFKTADVTIATNETFKEIAVQRGGKDPRDVFIVRSIPDLSRFKRSSGNPALKKGRKFLIGYVGIMGAQDGVDLLISAMHQLVNLEGRRDVQCAIVGSGTELDKLQAMSKDLGLEDYITFTGFLSGKDLLDAFSTFDIGAIPDPKNSYNDKISMNKVFEYMSMGIPFVQFDLIEGRKIAGDAAAYALDNSAQDMAAKFADLLDDETRRSQLAVTGTKRASALLNWENERAQLLAAYDMAFAAAGVPAAAARTGSAKSTGQLAS